MVQQRQLLFEPQLLHQQSWPAAAHYVAGTATAAAVNASVAYHTAGAAAAAACQIDVPSSRMRHFGGLLTATSDIVSLRHLVQPMPWQRLELRAAARACGHQQQHGRLQQLEEPCD